MCVDREKKALTYTTEEMSNENDKHSTCNIMPSIQALEGMRFSIAVKDRVSLYLA